MKITVLIRNSSFHSSTQTTLPEHNKPHLSREITKKKKRWSLLSSFLLHNTQAGSITITMFQLPFFCRQSHRHSKPWNETVFRDVKRPPNQFAPIHFTTFTMKFPSTFCWVLNNVSHQSLKAQIGEWFADHLSSPPVDAKGPSKGVFPPIADDVLYWPHMIFLEFSSFLQFHAWTIKWNLRAPYTHATHNKSDCKIRLRGFS